MPQIELKGLYSDMQKEMISKLRVGAGAFEHSGTKGEDTELNWIEWFRAYFPKRYAVDKGVVIDHSGKQSEQIDLIIYDTQYSHFVFHHNDKLLIPAESIYAVFEVKQVLNKKHMDYARKKAASVRELQRTSVGIQHAGGVFTPKALHEIVAGVLTTKSDWAYPFEQYIVKYASPQNHMERLDIACCISNCTVVFDNNTFVEKYDENAHPTVKYCNKDTSLVYLLLGLLKKLQNIGTVPAIDFLKYSEGMDIKTYNT